jgi:hypothetical protein
MDYVYHPLPHSLLFLDDTIDCGHDNDTSNYDNDTSNNNKDSGHKD